VKTAIACSPRPPVLPSRVRPDAVAPIGFGRIEGLICLLQQFSGISRMVGHIYRKTYAESDDSLNRCADKAALSRSYNYKKERRRQLLRRGSWLWWGFIDMCGTPCTWDSSWAGSGYGLSSGYDRCGVPGGASFAKLEPRRLPSFTQQLDGPDTAKCCSFLPTNK
jgi:hypothetical protein